MSTDEPIEPRISRFVDALDQDLRERPDADPHGVLAEIGMIVGIAAALNEG